MQERIYLLKNALCAECGKRYKTTSNGTYRCKCGGYIVGGERYPEIKSKAKP